MKGFISFNSNSLLTVQYFDINGAMAAYQRLYNEDPNSIRVEYVPDLPEPTKHSPVNKESGRYFAGCKVAHKSSSKGMYNMAAKPFIPSSVAISHSLVNQSFPTGYDMPIDNPSNFFAGPRIPETQVKVDPSLFMQPSYSYFQYCDLFTVRLPQESFYSAPLPTLSISEYVPHKGTDEKEARHKIHLLDILNGKDMRTTLMIRNIPNKYKQTMLLQEINIGHNMQYNFFYLPIDPRVNFYFYID